MQDFEKLGVFYLGREYDLEQSTLREDLLLYDSKDLVTHAVCVGMTGSGKTGLCIGLLEEAAIDGIPSIVVDPKGDLSNLLLTFPELKAKDFEPWINEEDASKKGLSSEEYAKNQASLWQKGLAEWGQDGSRIRRLRDAADFVIYTPGSSAGISVSILKSFESPGKVIVEDSDLMRERINTIVTSLLNLLGIEADPIQSREHILLSTIFHSSWQQGKDLDLARLIQTIQSPPIERVGVFGLESFFPSNERFALAMKLNNLLAAPGFSAWLEGEPLDIDRIFFTGEGKPKVSIFSIAHLSDAERMFFVSLLLTQLLGWMRTQSGTTSLRALFYMDEIFGYFPPVANPPSKTPLLTLLKQARAFGLGLVLATQNPVDLDYKGLSNTGTWFIGRLQTERDKVRVLDGLSSSSSGGRLDRQRMEHYLSNLGKRVFLMNNIHEDEPVAFQTRWVMSYLRGPLTRNQIKNVMDSRKSLESEKVELIPLPTTELSVAKEKGPPPRSSRPLLPPEIPQFFIPVQGDRPGDSRLFYEPTLLCIGKTYYANGKAGIATERNVSLLVGFSQHGAKLRWDQAQEMDITADDLERFPEDAAFFGDVPDEATKKKKYLEWGAEFRDRIYRSQKQELLKSPSLKTLSEPGESERDFRIRLQLVAHEKRDMVIDRIRKKYAPRIDRLEQRIRRSEQAVEREREQAKQQKLQTAISFGATLFSALVGRKAVSRSTLGRAATTAGRAGRIMKETQDVARAQENLKEMRVQLAELQDVLSQEVEQVKTNIDPLTEHLEMFVLKPKKSDIVVLLVALAWVPLWQNEKGAIAPAW